jgi:protein SCO1/2
VQGRDSGTDTSKDAAPRPSAPGSPIQPLVWAALGLVLTAVAVTALWSVLRAGRPGVDGAEPLPVYGTVPAFSLIERSGRRVGSQDLAGEIWIANFVFTRCPGMCPTLSARMAGLQATLGESGLPVRLVSISVDPTRDTPEVLRAYAERYRADPERWLFLTGPREAVHALVRDGFHLAVAELPPGEREAAPEPITHSDRFVLVDPALQIRSYYHGMEPGMGAAVHEAVERLRREAAP